jgi:DHA1 family inner membrane transport protein
MARVAESATRAPAGAGTLVLVAAGITGIVTSVTMIGALLVAIADDFGVSLAQAGLLATAAAVPQALGSPLSGLLSDRLGRRPMIVFALGSVGILAFAAALAPSLAVLAAIRFGAGLVGSLAPTSLMAAVGDLFPAGQRARAMGWLNMGFSFAGLAGVPLVGALVGGMFGWRWAFATIGGVLLLLALCMRIWFPDLPPVAAGTSVLATYRAVWGVRGLLSVLGANLVERSLFLMITIYLPAFLMLTYQISAVGVALILPLVAAGAIGGNVLGGWLGDRLPRPGLFLVSQVTAGGLALVLFGTRLGLPAAVALAALFALANATSRPGFLAYSSELAPRQSGALFGLVSLSNQAGVVLGSALGAAVIGAGGYRAFAAVVFALGVAAAALAVPLVRSPRPR